MLGDFDGSKDGSNVGISLGLLLELGLYDGEIETDGGSLGFRLNVGDSVGASVRIVKVVSSMPRLIAATIVFPDLF